MIDAAHERVHGVCDLGLRVMDSACIIAAGVFVWVFIGLAWFACTLGWHKKATRLAQHGAATVIGGMLGLALLVAVYFMGEWFGCRIMGRC